MPTADEPAPDPRPSRRPLGRGPGAAPAAPAAPPGPVPAGAEPGADAEPAARAGAEEPVAEDPGPAGAPAPRPETAAPASPPGPAAGPEGPEEPGGPEKEDPGPGPGPGTEGEPDDGRFKVVLDNFEGPFDLLLQLIARHKLDVTEVALSRVTDEFMAHIRAMGPDWDLDQATEFLVVAATLLDLKAARLLPSAEVEDEADLALLEARDLLFARLLQYRAYKQVAEILGGRLAAEARRHPRTVGLEPHHAELLPEVVIRIGPEGFARLAVKAMQPRPEPQVYVDHIHAPLVSVREQAGIVVARLRERGEASFAELVEDAPDTLTVVARFLALLELYRERAVLLDQPEALGVLTVRWSGGAAAAEALSLVTDEFDAQDGTGGATGGGDDKGKDGRK
ncbi:segregation/condensation protein A [Streptomyces sp. TRM 70361]|uniref:segregation and condensation protein A n=1 Tax=Streptomyces sp. TRM 70361 TaxID=3116553 RepID=UPI002E7BE39E|nr:segregation/condensation protein A [Streptomyces sp. TRM 70361]MEE1943239.1 segregation/condensation protein A [Streptomyces sp. TRM 70361]